MNKLFKNRKGQNTVEYLLMLAVVVGVVLVAGMMLKKYMPTLFQSIQGMINGAASTLGSSGGNQP
ncbi:MAG: class III signal peptide-containing protein [Elusimicrobia bacterium]|nr:class III signal peptide-containing protein [Elusimicrobiota bacterium]